MATLQDCRRCHHTTDNQGLCHFCGRVVNEDYYEAYFGMKPPRRYRSHWISANILFDGITHDGAYRFRCFIGNYVQTFRAYADTKREAISMARKWRREQE